ASGSPLVESAVPCPLLDAYAAFQRADERVVQLVALEDGICPRRRNPSLFMGHSRGPGACGGRSFRPGTSPGLQLRRTRLLWRPG
ncbi:MAG: hypothetical protein B7Y81_18525, partial [Caulobacter sp. 32-67-35]